MLIEETCETHTAFVLAHTSLLVLPSIAQSNAIVDSEGMSQENGLWLGPVWAGHSSWLKAWKHLLFFARLWLASLQCSCSLVQTMDLCVTLSQVGDKYLW